MRRTKGRGESRTGSGKGRRSAESEAGFGESAFDLFDVVEVTRFEVDAQEAADDFAGGVRVVVVDADDVGAAFGDDLGDGDELTGLVWAAALMRPSKSVMDMEVSSVKKKFKDKRFAAGC